MKKRTAGFRFSRLDGAVLAGGVVLAALAALLSAHLSYLLLFLLGHFFLFCNVFRISRGKEIAWSVVFVFNVMIWIAGGEFLWWGAALFQIPVTLLLVILEMRSPRYHGVGARAINKELDAYLKGTLVDRRVANRASRRSGARKA